MTTLMNVMTIIITILFTATLLLFAFICLISGIIQMCNTNKKVNKSIMEYYFIIRKALTIGLILYGIIAYFYYIYNY